MTLDSNWTSPFWFATIAPAEIRLIDTILGRITCPVMAVMIRSAMLTTWRVQLARARVWSRLVGGKSRGFLNGPVPARWSRNILRFFLDHPHSAPRFERSCRSNGCAGRMR
jgi:hypothetical protein